MSSTIYRLPWLDVARAICIISLVLTHFTLWVLAPSAGYSDVQWWESLNSFLYAARMPLLFAVSGFLVADRVRAGWGDRRNVLRVASSYYLYAVWLTIYCIIIAVAGSEKLPSQVTIGRYFGQWVVPQTPLWFVFFLAVGVALLTILHRVPAPVVLGGLIILSACTATSATEPGFDLMARGIEHLVYFAVGVYLKPLMTYLANGGLWWKALITIGGFLAARQSMAEAEWGSIYWVSAYLARNLLAIGAGIVVASAFRYAPPLEKALSYIGRRTLPIYVFHLPAIWAMIYIRALVTGDVIGNLYIRAASPALAAVGIIAASIALAALARKAKAGARMFDMPSTWREKILAR